MTTTDEKKIQKHLKAIAKICHRNGIVHLTTFTTEEVIDYNDSYWAEDKAQPLNAVSWDRGKTWQKRDF